MSEYFKIVNYTRRQFISLAGIQNVKQFGIGRSLGGLLFCRLLATESRTDEITAGRFGKPGTDELYTGAWIGEQVAITGDYARAEDYSFLPNLKYPDNLLWDSLHEGFEDITGKALCWLAKDALVHDDFVELLVDWGDNDHFRKKLVSIYSGTRDENIRLILELYTKTTGKE